ncbi:FliH/SctL family protein [Sphingomonas sp. 2R-10]|uniref:FliH/SctL family protein n=1 Tax=Sphingomonas sp. 2R-10 TaxID=3045148 RepID=UPI000F776363|nr:FliH/SctL family protein [Sphingomonas sp. 2R-10]MDJ0276566.1 FliH/SctL family protein [Sphingomonas sp. 2R-10]
MFESAPATASGFVAGFASRHVAAADILARAFGTPDPFAATGVMPVRPGDFGGSAAAGGPKHFRPADPDANPTEGWDPFSTVVDEVASTLDPVAEARAAGYAEGLAAAAAASKSDAARDHALLARLAEALGTATHVDREAMATRLRQTVLTLVRQIVGEVGVSANHLIDRIDAAADLLADGAESAILRMHEADIALVEGKLPKAVFPVADAQVERGGFILESASTVVEDGPSLWLEQLGAAIETVPVPN